MGVAIAATKIPNFKLVGTKYPVVKKGTKPEFGTAETIYNTNSGVAITTQCKNVELATKVLDYAYSEKGHLLYNFGIEGESYKMVDGKPTYTEEMYNYDKGDITASLKRYIMSIDHAPCIQDKGMYDQRLSYQEQKDAIELWADTNMRNHIIPHISFNQEENEINSDIWTDIDTYVQETTTKFIIGKKPIDEFDDYVQSLKNMGIDKVVAARQSAYERYMSR
jgi:putative aldouronate transport system substrate-binding protein